MEHYLPYLKSYGFILFADFIFKVGLKVSAYLVS